MNPMSDLKPVDVDIIRHNGDGSELVMTAELWLVGNTYCIIMGKPGDDSEGFILPDMIQNMIPIYLPMLRG